MSSAPAGVVLDRALGSGVRDRGVDPTAAVDCIFQLQVGLRLLCRVDVEVDLEAGVSDRAGIKLGALGADWSR